MRLIFILAAVFLSCGGFLAVLLINILIFWYIFFKIYLTNG